MFERVNQPVNAAKLENGQPTKIGYGCIQIFE